MYDFFMIHLWWVCALTLDFGNFSANLNNSDTANPNIFIIKKKNYHFSRIFLKSDFHT